MKNEKTIFELSSPGRKNLTINSLREKEFDYTKSLPAGYMREDIKGFPELSEQDVVRHFTRLSYLNYGVDKGFYPLGSCTMKYNPKVNEKIWLC